MRNKLPLMIAGALLTATPALAQNDVGPTNTTDMNSANTVSTEGVTDANAVGGATSPTGAAAVWRTSPARSISLWLTICASAGLSFRTGRKARDQRMARGCSGRGSPMATDPLLLPSRHSHCAKSHRPALRP